MGGRRRRRPAPRPASLRLRPPRRQRQPLGRGPRGSGVAAARDKERAHYEGEIRRLQQAAQAAHAVGGALCVCVGG